MQDGVAIGLACYRGAEPPNPQKCSGRCLGEVPARSEVLGKVLRRVLGKVLGRVLGKVLVLLFCVHEKRRTSTFPSTLPSTFPSTLRSTFPSTPHFGPALPQAPPRALLGVWGFGTSVASKANRKDGACLKCSQVGASFDRQLAHLSRRVRTRERSGYVVSLP